MASAYKVPYKKQLLADNCKLNKNRKCTLPQKRKLSSNILENETVDQDNTTGTSEMLPTKFRKSKRFNAKETKNKNPTITENKSHEAFEVASNNTESESIDDHEESTELPEKNFQASSTVQENEADMGDQMTNDIELKVDKDINELNKINHITENINDENRPFLCVTISNVYHEEEILEPKSMIQTDQVTTDMLSSLSACTDSYKSHLTAKRDLQDSISDKILNIDPSQKVNMSETVNTSIQELKILKIVLEDAYDISEKQGSVTGENVLKDNSVNMNNGVDIKSLKNIQEEVCNYKENINSQEIEKDFGSKDEWINKANILNSLEGNENNKENFEIQADDKEDQINESYCSTDVENKTFTDHINGNSINTFDNSSISDNSFDEEKCCLTLKTILNNETDQNIDLQKNVPNPKLDNKPQDINEHENQVNCNKKSPKFVSSKLKSTKKILTIPCMSALDYEKECEKKVTSEAENSPYFNEEEEHHKSSNPHILKDSANESFSEMQNLEDLKIQDGDIKQICVQVPHSSSQIMPENNNLNFKQEISRPFENSYSFNEIIQKDESKVLKDTIAKLYAENFNLNQPTNKTDCNISDDENLLVESIIFREKTETDDSDLIPTGVFKHLNEMYEYNMKTTLMQVKDSASTKPSIIEEILNEKEDKGASKLKSRAAWLEEESSFLVAAADCIKSIKNRKNYQNREDFDKQIADIKDKDEIRIQDNENMKEKMEMKEDAKNKKAPCTSEQPENEINNKTKKKLINEIPISRMSQLEEPDFFDIENCMEMDDDFALTASQLRMLDADEKIQSQSINRTTTSQQTDICGYTYFGNDAVTFEIINQLQYLRESVEYIRNKLEASTSDENTL